MKKPFFISLMVAIMLGYLFHKPILESFAKQLYRIDDMKKNSDAVIFVTAISGCKYDEIKYLYENNYTKNVVVVKATYKEAEDTRKEKNRVFFTEKETILRYLNKNENDVNITTIKFKAPKNDGFLLQKNIYEYVKNSGFKKVIIVESPSFMSATREIFSKIKLNNKDNIDIAIFAMIEEDNIKNWWRKEQGLLSFFHAFFSLLHTKISSLLGAI